VKVLHLGKLCPPDEGGIELFSYDLLEYLSSKSIKADLLCFGKKTFKDSYKDFDFYSCKMNIKLNSAPLSWNFVKTFKKIAKNYDLIHVHSPNPLAEVLSLFTSKKVVVHWHSDIVKQKFSYKLYKPIQQAFLKKADKIICTSPQYLESSEQLKNVKNKAVIIPSGLNPERLNSDKEDEKMKMVFDKLRGKKIVFALGRLVEYKGFKYLVEAGQYIGDDIAIIIAGSGPLYNDLNKRIYELNLQNKVFLIGRINIISSYMKNCDIFCLPSITRNEAFGLVLVEALYFGKPLITTDVKGSGMNYVNKHNITGLIVPPKDPKALAEAINKVLTDKKLYEKFSYSAKKRFKEFEISNIGNQILKLYEEVLK
jgi:glycosyltransferase involved in cell wall biosynthesis